LFFSLKGRTLSYVEIFEITSFHPKVGVAHNPMTIEIERLLLHKIKRLNRNSHTPHAEKDAFFRKIRGFASVVFRLSGNTVNSNSERKCLLLW